VASYIGFAAELPNERRQADFAHCWLADGAHAEILCFFDDHSALHRALNHPTIPHHHNGDEPAS
jgi:hypothetical protein